MCQKASGNFYMPLVSVRGAKLTWTRGEPSYFRSSNHVQRGFCGKCGTPLTFTAPDGVALAIGAFDEPAEVAPTIQWGIEAKLPFVDEIPGLPGEETMADIGSRAVTSPTSSPTSTPTTTPKNGRRRRSDERGVYRRMPVRRGALPRRADRRQRPHLPLPHVPEGGRQLLCRAGRRAEDKVTWTRGKPAVFKSSEHVERGFCGECGTPLFYNGVDSKYISLTIGSMDHPERLKPKSQDGVEGRLPWFSELFDVPDDPPTEAGDSAEWAAAIKRTNRQHPDHDTEQWPPADGKSESKS